MEPAAIEPRHVCGQCGDEYLTEAEYLAHQCPKTGYVPTQPEHLGPEFTAVQTAALQRGLDTLEAQGADTSSQVAAIDQLAAPAPADTPAPSPAAPDVPVV